MTISRIAFKPKLSIMFQIIVSENLINLLSLGSQSEQNLALDYFKDSYVSLRFCTF